MVPFGPHVKHTVLQVRRGIAPKRGGPMNVMIPGGKRRQNQADRKPPIQKRDAPPLGSPEILNGRIRLIVQQAPFLLMSERGTLQEIEPALLAASYNFVGAWQQHRPGRTE